MQLRTSNILHRCASNPTIKRCLIQFSHRFMLVKVLLSVGPLFWAIQRTPPQSTNNSKQKHKNTKKQNPKKPKKSKIQSQRGSHAKHSSSVPTRMATAFSFAQTALFSKTSLSLRTNALRSFTFCLPFSSSAALASDKPHSKKWRQPVTSALELGGVKIAKDGNFSLFSLYI